MIIQALPADYQRIQNDVEDDAAFLASTVRVEGYTKANINAVIEQFINTPGKGFLIYLNGLNVKEVAYGTRD